MSTLKKPAGRPPKIDRGSTLGIYLYPESIANAQAMGDGNISVGVRKALAAVDEDVLYRAKQLGNGCTLTGLRKALGLTQSNRQGRVLD